MQCRIPVLEVLNTDERAIELVFQCHNSPLLEHVNTCSGLSG